MPITQARLNDVLTAARQIEAAYRYTCQLISQSDSLDAQAALANLKAVASIPSAAITNALLTLKQEEMHYRLTHKRNTRDRLRKAGYKGKGESPNLRISAPASERVLAVSPIIGEANPLTGEELRVFNDAATWQGEMLARTKSTPRLHEYPGDGVECIMPPMPDWTPASSHQSAATSQELPEPAVLDEIAEIDDGIDGED